MFYRKNNLIFFHLKKIVIAYNIQSLVQRRFGPDIQISNVAEQMRLTHSHALLCKINQLFVLQ